MRLAAAPLALLLVAGAVQAQAHVQKLSWDEALQRLRGGSDQLAAARAGLAHKQARAEGIAGLGGPSVSLTGAAYRYKASLDIDLDPLSQRLDQIVPQLPPLLGQVLPALPQLPHSYTLERSNSGSTASLSAVWPLYLGGATEAARGLAAAQTAEASADLQSSEHEAAAQLAQRYFLTQLARRAAALREAAAEGIAAHDAAAEKMLATGVLSRLERLQARAALEDARYQARKARSDADLAALALARSLKLDAPPQPSTPLALSLRPLPPLQDFIIVALANHPGLAKVAAKKEQASELQRAGKALNKPQLFAFGQRSLTHNGDWVAGIGLRMNLWDSLDHGALDRSHASQIAQADATDAQARSDIALLVERQWRATENAREQYLSLQAQDELAHELLRLRLAGLRQGTSTTLDLIDAELNLAKQRTGRAQVAYDYVMALTGLLQACGQLDSLGDYLNQAALRIE
ncbi:TolC family protein [Paucibacter sp. XJ19-41]|uniref:TolC family protein n=1 Tax=Paucibacter sp. XJ19-41 TaxID=2927824 RepID=UPI0023491CF7|nr:TolC family protein [Paucibacter sp. XJ19-41]MDC6167609.1 TolC family protein [Paucibacter sp. XJ19-41]